MGAPSIINVYGVSILPPCLGYCICKYMVTLVFSKLSIILHCNFPMMPLALKVPKRKQHCRDSRLAWRAMHGKWVDSQVHKINTRKGPCGLTIVGDISVGPKQVRAAEMPQPEGSSRHGPDQ